MGLIRDWLIDPIGLIFLLSIVVFLLLARNRMSLGLLLAAFTWLGGMFIMSAPRIVNPMLLHYENQYQAQPDCLAARPIVLLGGGVDSRVKSKEQVEHMGHRTFVRATAANELAKTFIDVPVIVAGGALRTITEAEILRHYLLDLGIPSARIHEESTSQNTFENARNVRALIEQREFDLHINLITSALHMKRAKAVFEKQGLTVCPVAVDRHGIENVPNYAMWPQITALQKFDLLLHEQIGWWAYRIKGRL